MKEFSDVRQLAQLDGQLGVAAVLAFLWSKTVAFWSVVPQSTVLIMWAVRMALGTGMALYRREWTRENSARGIRRFAMWTAVLLLCSSLRDSGPIAAAVSAVVACKIAIIEFAGILSLLGLQKLLPTTKSKEESQAS